MVTKKLPTLGIVAGRGHLPKLIIDECKRKNRDFVVIVMYSFAKLEDYKNFTHEVIRIGQVAKALKFLRSHGVKEMVMTGGITKPSLASVKPDATGAKLLAKLMKTKIFGDNNVFKTVIAFMESQGMRVIGVKDVLKDIVAKKGEIGSVKVRDKEFRQDIKLGQDVLRATSKFDIGQALVVQQRMVIGIECIGGTDELITRCGKLKYKAGRKPVLVKFRKAGQSDRADLPTIGLETIKNAVKAGFGGIAVEAEGVLLLDKKQMIEYANKNKIFIVGI
jgi:DUF1009 family protein